MRSNGKQYLGTLQNFSSILVYKGNELQKIQEDGNKLTEELAVEKEQLEIQNNKALSFQRSFHDSFENVLKKQRCWTHFLVLTMFRFFSSIQLATVRDIKKYTIYFWIP